MPIECFPLTYDLNGLTNSRINKHILSVGFFFRKKEPTDKIRLETDFPDALIFLLLFFL